MDSLAFLQRPGKVQPVYALAGDDDFLRRQVVLALRKLVLGEGEDAFGLSTFTGEKAGFAEVRNELHTVPFLAPGRLVVIEDADPFVTRHRAALEKYLEAPATTGVLVLSVKSWPANTRLAKQLPPAATIQCKAPAASKLPEWCVRRMASQFEKQLTADAARLLVDLVGAEMGQLDQEITKLATFAGEKAARVSADDVDRLVGSSRTQVIWHIFDAIGAGEVGKALTILNGLFEQGEEPIRLLGAFSNQLRRLAQAARLAEQGESLGAALQQAGVPPFALRGAEQQLRHLGKRRTDRLFDWLLEADLGLKGSSALPPRVQFERLVIRLAAAG